MKRYIKEFAADRIKSLEYANTDIKQKAIERINKVVNLSEPYWFLLTSRLYSTNKFDSGTLFINTLFNAFNPFKYV